MWIATSTPNAPMACSGARSFVSHTHTRPALQPLTVTFAETRHPRTCSSRTCSSPTCSPYDLAARYDVIAPVGPQPSVGRQGRLSPPPHNHLRQLSPDIPITTSHRGARCLAISELGVHLVEPVLVRRACSLIQCNGRLGPGPMLTLQSGIANGVARSEHANQGFNGDRRSNFCPPVVSCAPRFKCQLFTTEADDDQLLSNIYVAGDMFASADAGCQWRFLHHREQPTTAGENTMVPRTLWECSDKLLVVEAWYRNLVVGEREVRVVGAGCLDLETRVHRAAVDVIPTDGIIKARE